MIPGIHYFDAHRIQPLLLNSLEHQIDPRSMKLAGPESAGDTVNDPSSDEEEVSTDAEKAIKKTPRSHGAHRYLMQLKTLLKMRSQVRLTNWLS